MKTATIAGLAVLGLVVAGCGDPGSQASGEKTVTTTPEVVRPSGPVDDVFDVDGVGFHLHCTGDGDTTVLLIAGWGAGGDQSWSTVHPTLAEQARVCTYDRPGTGTSDAPTTDQTFETEVIDLRALLETAGEPGPFVVVGHSFGGAQAVAFAAGSPDDVTGIVLVDATPATWPGAVCAVPDDGTPTAATFRQLCQVFHNPQQDSERLDVIPAFEHVAAISSLGDLPLTVITADTRTAPGLATAELDRLNEVWGKGVDTWADLSHNSTVVTVTDTSHYIQLERPDVVIGEVSAMLRRCAEAKTRCSS